MRLRVLSKSRQAADTAENGASPNPKTNTPAISGVTPLAALERKKSAPERRKSNRDYWGWAIGIFFGTASIATPYVFAPAEQQAVALSILGILAVIVFSLVIFHQSREIRTAFDEVHEASQLAFALQRELENTAVLLRNKERCLEAELLIKATLEKDLASVADDKASAVSIAEKELHSAYRDIAERFNTLSMMISEFESAVFHYFGTLVAGTIDLKVSHVNRTRIEDSFNDVMQDICNTAAFVIERRKRKFAVPGQCSANIKFLISGEKGQRDYYPFARSGGGAGRPDRRKRDQFLREKPTPVETHKVYVSLANERTPDHFLCRDLETLLHEVGPEFSKPALTDAVDYCSFLTVAIVGKSSLGDAPGDKGHKKFSWVPRRTEKFDQLLGFFCVDSQERDFFDDEYDRHIMEQLASMIFDCARAYEAVETISGAMKINHYDGYARVRTTFIKRSPDEYTT